MYNLYKINENRYQIHSSFEGDGAFEGNLASIYKHCVNKLGISDVEIEAALVDMVRNDHDGANFGMNRYYLFTFNRNQRKVS